MQARLRALDADPVLRRSPEKQPAPPLETPQQTGWLASSGIFIEGGGIFNLLVPAGGFWPAAAAGFQFPFGIILRGEVLAPFATVSAGLAWEMLSTALRPFAWGQLGYALIRSLKQDTPGGFLVTFGAGLKWYPWDNAGLWGAIRAGVALDMARERRTTPIPIMLSVGYQL